MQIRVSGLEETISRLKKYRDTLDAKQHKLLERLAEIGINTATLKFKSAQYDGKKDDVEVDPAPEWIGENRLLITARGKAVTFIEFGAGVVGADEHEKAAELGMIRGQYGQGKGANPKGWTYYGEGGTNGTLVRESDRGNVYHTFGNPPARAMYLASEEMRRRIAEIAREVYHGD